MGGCGAMFVWTIISLLVGVLAIVYSVRAENPICPDDHVLIKAYSGKMACVEGYIP